MDPNVKEEEGTTKENLDGGCARDYHCQRVGDESMDGQRGMATLDGMIPEQ